MATDTKEIDNRGLQPPQPMVRILEALEQLAPGERLLARNDREPVFLFPELVARGFQYAVTPLEDGTFHVLIWKD